MKPLELTIYERDEDGYYVDARGWLYVDADVEVYADIKRFSDAELAAEYWAPIHIHFPDPSVWESDYSGSIRTMKHRMEVLHRFATLPHYDEQP